MSKLLIHAATQMDHQGIMLSGEKKKANHKRSHTIWFHLCNILEMTKLQRWKTDYFLGLRMAREWTAGEAIKVQQRERQTFVVTESCTWSQQWLGRQRRATRWHRTYTRSLHQCRRPAFLLHHSSMCNRRQGAGDGQVRPLCTISATFCDAIVSSKFKV